MQACAWDKLLCALNQKPQYLPSFMQVQEPNDRYEREKANEHANWVERSQSDRCHFFRMAPAYDCLHQEFTDTWKMKHQSLVNESCRHHAASCLGPECSAHLVVSLLVPENALHERPLVLNIVYLVFCRKWASMMLHSWHQGAPSSLRCQFGVAWDVPRKFQPTHCMLAASATPQWCLITGSICRS